MLYGVQWQNESKRMRLIPHTFMCYHDPCLLVSKDPGGRHVGPMNVAIWVYGEMLYTYSDISYCGYSCEKYDGVVDKWADDTLSAFCRSKTFKFLLKL